MPTYRCYTIDPLDKVGSGTSFDADDDAAALVKAAADFKTSLAYPNLEIWQGKRIVGYVPER
jgi:hypothetical protein